MSFFCLNYIIGISKALPWLLCFLAFPGELLRASRPSFGWTNFCLGNHLFLGLLGRRPVSALGKQNLMKIQWASFEVLGADLLRIVYSPTLEPVQMVLKAGNGAYPIPLLNVPYGRSWCPHVCWIDRMSSLEITWSIDLCLEEESGRFGWSLRKSSS